MRDKLRFLLNRLRERLWVKPLAICVLSIAGVFVAKLADGAGPIRFVPQITSETIQALLSIMAASMLVIATFAVASMVSAYASASNAATPRSFSLVVSDDVSQNALSTFIGAFIFSIVGLTASTNGYFDVAGRLALFVLTCSVFGVVILTFLRWVDRIARLGRLGNTIDRVEMATEAAMRRRRGAPTLNGAPIGTGHESATALVAPKVGYVQRVDLAVLQDCATRAGGKVVVAALPGTFAAPGRALAHFVENMDGMQGVQGMQGMHGEPSRKVGEGEERPAFDRERAQAAFVIGDGRVFDDDPRFGLVVLSEIASRALSPAVNDPGTAIDIIGTLVRLFVRWAEPRPPEDVAAPKFDRVEIPELSTDDMFDDAFMAIGRDGAAMVEVVVRLQKAMASLASLDDAPMRGAAIRHARLALARAEKAMDLPEDLAVVRRLASFTISKS